MKCASQDICQVYKDGKCMTMLAMLINIDACSKRELTAEGKSKFAKGERK